MTSVSEELDPYQICDGAPDIAEYCRLRVEAGLSAKSTEAAQLGLVNTIYGVTVMYLDEPVGMGRLIGDGGTAFQIVDIAVLPAHQGKGLGKRIMAALTAYIEAELPETAYVSLIADGPAKHLYAQFGFAETAPASVGMARTIAKRS